MTKTPLFLLSIKRKLARKKIKEWLKSETKSTQEREAKRIKIYSKTLMINLAINLLLSKLLKAQLNLHCQPLLLMRTDLWIKWETQMICSTWIRVNMIETLILLVLSRKIGKITITKEVKTLERLTLQLFKPIIFLFQTHGRELLQSTNQSICNQVISKKQQLPSLAYQEFLLLT